MNKPSLTELSIYNFEELCVYKNNSYFRYLFQDVGEHYKLLKYISKNLSKDSHIFDIGTSSGLSAYALASGNPNIIVHTYDIGNFVLPEVILPNIEYHISDSCLDNPHLVNSPFILIDALKDCVYEQKIVDHLIIHSHKGIVMFDDIYLDIRPEFKTWYKNLSLSNKSDWTDIGHLSGTGIIEFK